MRRLRKAITGLLVVAVWAAVLAVVPAGPAAASHFCEEPDDDCDAYWWDNVFGSVDLTGTQPDTVITATIVTGFPTAQWVWTETGWNTSGVSGVTVSVPGEILGGSGDGWTQDAIGGSSVRFTPQGEAGPPPPDRQNCGNPCGPPPGNRWDEGTTMSVTFRSSESGGQVRATFGGNLGYIGWSDTAIRHVDGRDPNRPPVADIVIVDPPGETTSASGEFTLRAGSVDPDGDTLSHEWDFGNDDTSSGTTVTARYETPGNYTVTLTSTDPDELHDEDSELLSVPAPTLSSVITVAEDSRSVAVGEEFDATVTLTAQPNGVGDINTITFAAGALEVPEFLEIVSDPPTFPTSLGPGDSHSQTFRLKALAPGEGTLRSRPTGIDAAGGPALVTPGEQPIRVRRIDLDVSLEIDTGEEDHEEDDGEEGDEAENEIEIEEKADGPQPKQVTVTVTVTNDNNEDVENVEIAKQLVTSLVDGTFLYVEPAEAQPFWPVDDEQPGPGAPLPDGLNDGFSLLGTVPANGNVAVEFVINVTDDGVYGLESQILYVVDDENETSTGATELTAVPDKLAYFNSRMPDGTPPQPVFQSGDSFTVFGDVENRSNTREISVTALVPTIEGESMGGGFFIKDTQEFPPPGSCAAPYRGLLEPGAKVPLHGQFTTLESEGTRAFFRYVPTFYEFDEENNPVEIGADELLIDNPRQQISLRDFVNVEPPPFDLLEAFAGFSAGAGQALIAFVWEPVQFAAWVAKGVLWELPQLAIVNGAYLAKWWLTIPVEEKAAYLADVVAQALQAIDDITIEEVWGSVEEATAALNTYVENMWTEYLQKWENGDWFEAFRVIGRVVGEVGLEIATSGALCLAHTDKAQNAVRIQDEIIQASRGVVRTQDELDAIRVGSKLTDDELSVFGIPDRMARALRALAGEGYLLTWRPRNPDSLRWLARGAIQKPQPLKIKTVSELDRYLGYDVVADGGSLVLKKPNPNVDEVLAGVPEELRELVRQRWQLRMNEWQQFTHPNALEKRKLPDGTPVTNPDGTFVFDEVLVDGDVTPNPYNYLAWNEAGEMPWPGIPTTPDGTPGSRIGIDVASNGIDHLNTQWTRNGFELDPVAGQSDTWVIKAADRDGNLQRITGDLDALDIRHGDGRPLSGDEVIELYERLADITGLDHGETVTWRLNGQTLHPSQVDILAFHGHPNGKSLVQFAPDGEARKVLLDRNLSVFSAEDPRKHYIFYRGGYLSASGALRTVRTNLDTFFPDALQRLLLLIVPASWLGDLIDRSDQEPGSGSCSWRYGGGSGAALMRYTGTNYEIYNDSAWQPLDVSGICVDDGLAPAAASGGDALRPAAHGGDHEIVVRPHTVLNEPLAAGATSASIFDLSKIEFALPEGSTWFEPGQVVAIDPGGPNEEFVTLTGVDPIRWERPLARDHLEGEWIAVIADPAEVLGTVEFFDVPNGRWFSDAVDWGAQERIVFGTSDGIFDPHLVANRAMLITMLWRAAGSPEVTDGVPFTDVDLDAYYGPALRWAYSVGIVKGTSPTTFSPDDRATRAHAITVLWRWFGSPSPTMDNPFGDVPAGRFFTAAAIWAAEVGASTGIGPGAFGPDLDADRATVITLIYRTRE